MQVFVLGFREFIDFVKKNKVASDVLNLSANFSSAILPAAIAWSAFVVENADSTLTVAGFLGGKSCQEKSLKVGKIRSAHLGETELCIIDDNGSLKVFDVAADNVEGQLRENSSQAEASTQDWKKLDRFESGGDLFAITVKGKLYSLDRNLVPTWIPLLLKVTKISCGISHGIVLAQNGTVYSWGTGSRGQLGHGCLQDETKPKLVDILCGVGIASISAGGWHSVALAETGDIYTWGWNESGQLGFPASDTHQHPKERHPGSDTEDPDIVAMFQSPTLLQLENHLQCSEFVSIIDVSCGSRHTAAVTKDGEAVTWGWGKYGQLGQSCCWSASPTDYDNSQQGPKRKKVDPSFPNSKLCKCGSNPHLPGYVEYFRTERLRVVSVKCKHWNTFFATDDGVPATE